MIKTLNSDPCPVERMAERASGNKIVLVIAKDVQQAKHLWLDIKHKYEHLGRVKFVSNRPEMLQGLNHEGMTIIYVGEYWLNKTYSSDVVIWFERLGAEVIYEYCCTEK